MTQFHVLVGKYTYFTFDCPYFYQELLSEYLLKTATTDESKVFYHKMQGDYYRYLAEVANNKPGDESGESCP